MPVSFFISNNHATGSFWLRTIWIILIIGKLLVLVSTDFFAKGGNTVYTSYWSWMIWFLLQRNPMCCMNTSTSKLEHAFLVGLALKEGNVFAY